MKTKLKTKYGVEITTDALGRPLRDNYPDKMYGLPAKLITCEQCGHIYDPAHEYGCRVCEETPRKTI